MTDGLEFDRIAPTYDETRRPPSPEELATLTELLRGCRTVLDAGVGTGRFAAPLRDLQFDVLGIDLSLGMMRRARAKGVVTLVRADVLHLPIRDRAVDAVFMAHVLQLIADPRQALRELGRVARNQVVVQLPEWCERRPSSEWRDRRARYRELAAEMGYPLPERGKRYWHNLDELSAIARPRSVQAVVRPPWPEPPSDERLAEWTWEMFGEGRVPREVHAEILRRLRAERPFDSAARRRARTTQFVAWDPALLAAIP